VGDGFEADSALATEVYDGTILDFRLPRRDGLALLRQLRAARNPIPVLITNAIASRAWTQALTTTCPSRSISTS